MSSLTRATHRCSLPLLALAIAAALLAACQKPADRKSVV